MELSKQNKLLLNRASPATARMVENGLLGDVFVAELNTIINLARGEGAECRGTPAVLKVHADSSPPPKAAPPHPGFLVWNPNGRVPQYRHDTLDSAVTEAKRLAVQAPDTRFYVMAPACSALSERTILPVTLALVEPSLVASDWDENPVLRPAMIANTDAVLEYLPGSPTVLERTVLTSNDATAALKRALQRFGLAPDKVGFSRGDKEKRPGEILIMARDKVTGQPVPIGRFLWGIDWSELATARQGLIDEQWLPKPPAFDMTLPDGRNV